MAKKKKSQVQQELAIERTVMANTRTLLSYFRSSVGLLVAGAGLLKFISQHVWIVIGWVCIALAPIIMIIGIVQFVVVRRKINTEIEEVGDDTRNHME